MMKKVPKVRDRVMVTVGETSAQATHQVKQAIEATRSYSPQPHNLQATNSGGVGSLILVRISLSPMQMDTHPKYVVIVSHLLSRHVARKDVSVVDCSGAESQQGALTLINIYGYKFA